MKPACAYFAVALVTLVTPAAFAKVIDQDATIAGMPLHYKVVLPKDYDASKAYPAVLAFPPGGQGMDMVQTTLARNWAGEAQKRGYIVVIPAAPLGHLFYEDGARVFPEFLNKLLNDYKIRDNKFHIAGMSNGGISAFYIAASYPMFFSSVTGFPGYLPDATPERLKALSNLCVHMHVGEFGHGLAECHAEAGCRSSGGWDQRPASPSKKGNNTSSSALTGEGAVRLFDEIEQDCGPLQGAGK